MSDKPKSEVSVERDEFINELDAYTTPVKPRDDTAHYHHGRPYKFYQKYEGRWDKMWLDFCTGLDDKGKTKYRTVWSYINGLTKKVEERKWLFEMIGPKPEPVKGKKLRVPWLGDWQERRRLFITGVEDPAKFQEIRDAWKSKLTGLQAARATAPNITKYMMAIDSIGDKVHEAFNGQLFIPSKAPDDPANLLRTKTYLDLMERVLHMQEKLRDEWYRAHGLDPIHPNEWYCIGPTSLPALPGESPVIEGQIIAQRAGPGEQNQLPPGITIDDLLMAKAMRTKAKLYGMKMPGTLDNYVADIEGKEIDQIKKEKSNGRTV